MKIDENGIKLTLSFTKVQKWATGLIVGALLSAFAMVADGWRKIGKSYDMASSATQTLVIHGERLTKSDKRQDMMMLNQQVMFCEMRMMQGQSCPIQIETSEE